MRLWRFFLGFASLAIVLNAQDTAPLLNQAGTGPLKPEPQKEGEPPSRDTVRYWNANPIPAQDTVYVQERYSSDRKTVAKWRLSSFSDGRWALETYDSSGISVTGISIWDGRYDRHTHPGLRMVTSWLMNPSWGAGQMTVLAMQTATKQLKGVLPDYRLLIIPNDYKEVLPSQMKLALWAAQGLTPPPCVLDNLVKADAAYMSWQVERPFAIERIIQTVGTPRILYKIFRTGTIVRQDFRGTDIKTTIMNPLKMERVAVDPIGKSVTTYPWDATDTAAWSELVHAPEGMRSASITVKDSDEPALPLEGYTEHSPSETYLAFMSVTSQKPDERYLAVVKAMDAAYKGGQDELTKRNSPCTSSGTPRQ